MPVIVGFARQQWDRLASFLADYAAGVNSITEATRTFASRFIVIWLMCAASLAALLGPLYWAQRQSLMITPVDSSTCYCQHNPTSWAALAADRPVPPNYEVMPGVGTGHGDPAQQASTGIEFSNNSKSIFDFVTNIMPAHARMHPGREPDMVQVDCRFETVDFSTRKAGLLCVVILWGNLTKPPTYTGLKLPQNQSLIIDIGLTSLELADGAYPTLQELTIPLGSSRDQLQDSTLLYPHTQMSWGVKINAYTWDNATDKLISGVPLTVSMSAYQLPLFQVDISCTIVDETHQPGMFAQLTVSGTVALSIFSVRLLHGMQAAMWAMAGLAFVTTVWWAFREEKLRFDLLAFQGTMLFALPTMRQLWPAAPPGGTSADVMHIYAQLLLISCGIVILLLRMLFVMICAQPVIASRGGSGALTSGASGTASSATIAAANSVTNAAANATVAGTGSGVVNVFANNAANGTAYGAGAGAVAGAATGVTTGAANGVAGNAVNGAAVAAAAGGPAAVAAAAGSAVGATTGPVSPPTPNGQPCLQQVITQP
jgi:hypothetical protein